MGCPISDISGLKPIEFFIDGNAKLVHQYFEELTKVEQMKVVYFGDNYWSDVISAAKFNPYPEQSGRAPNWDGIAIIEEMHTFDQSLNDENNPNLLDTERYWGSYFTDDVPEGTDSTRLVQKRNFFVAETEAYARYALPHIRNISAFMT